MSLLEKGSQPHGSPDNSQSQVVGANGDADGHPKVGVEPERGPRVEDQGQAPKLAVDKIPREVWVVAVAGAAERFAFYCLSAPLQNYMQNERRSGANPGALGLGQQTATNISNAFLLAQFIAPMVFAALSDLRFGRLKTLMVSLIIYQCGSLILFVTSLPVSLNHGAGLPGLIVALFLIAFGVAGVKATMPPLLVDQYTRTEPIILKARGCQTVISDRTLTLQFITNLFFWLTNVASLSSLASTWMEKKVDFWASYVMAFACLLVTQTAFISWKKHITIIEAEKTSLPLALKALWCAVTHRFSLKAASPEYQKEIYGKDVPWDSAALEDVKRALVIARVLLFSCPFYLSYIQIMNNLISQAGQMRLGGIPNDTMQVFNPVACIILGPIIQRGLFPSLRRVGIEFRPIARISMGCLVMALAMAYAAGNQHLIYSKGPCYDHPLACPEAQNGDQIIGNKISVWIQTPVWFILAVGEILGFATISEIAYEMAPRSMKTLVQSVTQLTAGLATVVGIALSPITRDPTLVILYSVIAGLTLVAAALFWLFFKQLDRRAG